MPEPISASESVGASSTFGPYAAGRYRIPFHHLAQAVYFLVLGRPRNLGVDFDWLVPHLPSFPIVEGTENLPARGPLVIVGNHYQRDGLWMGWSAMLLGRAIYEHCGSDVHWIAITEWDNYRIAGIPIPNSVTRFIFDRFFRTFGFIGMVPPSAPVADRARSVRKILETVSRGGLVGIFPEGGIGETPALIEAVPGSGALVLRLSRLAPVVPAAVYDSEEGLVIRFGSQLSLTLQEEGPKSEQDAKVRAIMMGALARLLPESLRGPF